MNLPSLSNQCSASSSGRLDASTGPVSFGDVTFGPQRSANDWKKYIGYGLIGVAVFGLIYILTRK